MDGSEEKGVGGVKKIMRLCGKCFIDLSDGFDVSKTKSSPKDGKCEFCGKTHPLIYEYEITSKRSRVTNEKNEKN